MNFSKQFLEQLAGDLDTLADFLDNDGREHDAERVWRVRKIVLGLIGE